MSRRLLLPLVVVATGLLAACVPVTPAPPPSPPTPQPVSQFCAPTTPTTATTYQSAFDSLRKTYTEWATADGAVPIRLPDGRTLWMFGDTFVGKVNGSSGAIEPNWEFVSNSAVLQTASCFRPMMGGKPLARSSWIPDPGTNQAYWPASAIVDAAHNRLFVFLLHVLRSGPFGFTVVGTRVATFTLPTLGLASVSPVDLTGTSEARPYGSTSLTDGQYAYMYSTNGGAHHVARAPIGTARQQSTWEYWDGTGWSTAGNFAAAQPMSFTGPTVEVGVQSFSSPIAPLRVEPYGDGFLGTAMVVDGISRDVVTYTAPAAEGPWTFAGYVATTPAGVKSYGAQTPSGIQGAAGAILVHSVNVDAGVPVTIGNCGFRFASLTLPPPPVVTTDVPETSTSTEPSTTTSSSTTSTSTASTSPTSTSTTTTSAPP